MSSALQCCDSLFYMNLLWKSEFVYDEQCIMVLRFTFLYEFIIKKWIVHHDEFPLFNEFIHDKFSQGLAMFSLKLWNFFYKQFFIFIFIYKQPLFVRYHLLYLYLYLYLYLNLNLILMSMRMRNEDEDTIIYKRLVDGITQKA